MINLFVDWYWFFFINCYYKDTPIWLDCGRQAAKPRTRWKCLSVDSCRGFFISTISFGMGDLISVLQPRNKAKWLKRRLYVKDKVNCARAFKLAEQLLKEIKQHKTKNQPQAKVYQIPKWLLGRERLYAPNKKEDKWQCK